MLAGSDSRYPLGSIWYCVKHAHVVALACIPRTQMSYNAANSFCVLLTCNLRAWQTAERLALGVCTVTAAAPRITPLIHVCSHPSFLQTQAMYRTCQCW
jgi:hypothetical protein